MNTRQEQIIRRKLEAEGVSNYAFDKWKLYSPNTFDKFAIQVDINEKTAIRDYKGLIKRGGRIA